MGEIWQCQFPRWSQQCFRHYDQDERQRGGSRHWDSIKPVLMRAFAHQGARDFDDGFWSRLIHDGSTKKWLEYCQDEDGNLSYFRAIQGHTRGIPTSPELMKLHTCSIRLEKYFFHGGSQWVFQSILGSGIISGGKEEDKARQAVFLTPLNPFEKDPEGETPHSEYTVLQKAPYETNWKRNQDAVSWVRLKEAQGQGLEFWQTISVAIMTYVTIPGDCIDRVTAQNRDRVFFESLATPRPAPEVTLKRNWQSQL